jgi:hypothetical protein
MSTAPVYTTKQGNMAAVDHRSASGGIPLPGKRPPRKLMGSYPVVGWTMSRLPSQTLEHPWLIPPCTAVFYFPQPSSTVELV